jgi:hypothetical protein
VFRLVNMALCIKIPDGDTRYQDAVLACEAGCEGIVLSNHGGVPHFFASQNH